MNYNLNIQVLQRNYPEIYNKIKDVTIDGKIYEKITTKNELITIKVKMENRELYLHSKYNPINEAEKFINDNYDSDSEAYVVYGFGLAYHIKELLKRKTNGNIYIFETNKNIFKLALENIDLQDILEDKHVHLILEDNVKAFTYELSNVLNQGIKLLIHLPSTQIMSENFTEVKYLLEDYRIKEHTMRDSSLLDKNFYYNINNYDNSIDVLFSRFKNTPLIIVSAGPSLEKNKHFLKGAYCKAIILAVGTAVKPLLEAGIRPDLIIITDPHDIVYNQLENINIDIPIIILSTCNKKVMKNYQGYKFIAFQNDYELAEIYAKEKNLTLVNTGGSVATTALDIAIKFGCNPIIFVGQDLAYTDDKSHISGTLQHKEITAKKLLRYVPAINGDLVATNKSLYIYLKWIENRIKKEKEITFINATEGGANIEGTIIMSLQQVIVEVLKENNYSFTEIIEEVKTRNDYSE